MTINALYKELETSRIAWGSLNDLLVNGSYDFGRQRPVLDQQSMEVFRRRVDLVFEVLFSLRPQNESDVAHLVIGSKLAELRAHLLNFQRHLDGSLSQLRSPWRDGLTIQDGNDNFLWQLMDGPTNVSAVDVTPNFQQMHPALNYLVGAIGMFLPLCKANGVADLLQRVEAFGNANREAELLRRQTQEQGADVSATALQVAAHEKEARDHVVQAQTVVASLREVQVKAAADASNVATLVEQIKTVGANSDKLEALIGTYTSKFEAFQKELDARNSEFTQFQTDSKTATDANVKRETEIDRLTTLADAMISGSTTAGLAKSLEVTRKRYEDRMTAARTGFMVSIAILVLSALPLAAHLLPGLFGDFFPRVSDTAHESWYGVLGKVLLMVPATWLTGFYTKTFADFFHLEREYAHKAALAMSVDGFKRQAPKYEEEITAEVFLEIRNNPAKGSPVEPASHPLYDVLSKVVGKVLDKKKE
ncbi:hypothetical protein [Rhodoferax mekongensis]|uniref:Uncharacterized protein n=1 Tax=Rhodoferax mekongensis TaxID=3068341 RepID=A0ABZ0B1K5_9BURK|nr:hypothetical protein [Rhodoferax sp. TBRC 17307]WNO04817.1 hypothetical protein RAN89_18305 [Rhodoferax sp. TBRC 17307]